MREQDVAQMVSVLNCFDRSVLLSALKLHNQDRKKSEAEVVDRDGWELLPEGSGIPDPPTEWRKLGGKTFIRRPENRRPGTTTKSSASSTKKKSTATSGVMACPYCGAQTFEQPVCKKCEKGKAGIRSMYVCGENADHVFYTE